MTQHDTLKLQITADVLLKAYSCGIFPMAESADDWQLFWIEPQIRGILPLDRLLVPKRLSRTIRKANFEIRIDYDFDGVIRGCAEPTPGRSSTWINDRIHGLYKDLFNRGHCHTVEVWNKDNCLVGGLYGVSLGGVFFGESMFSRERDVSKIALVYLCARLIYGNFIMLDTQFITDHLRQFGAVEIDRMKFQEKLNQALKVQGNFSRLPQNSDPNTILDIILKARLDI
ncbi:MAG: leucyl/phenylalanyl-tRNA--protein transferase [Hyphomicrobiaceae bacterium]|nr:leucyl/phenylalanyl-tRNA--protein transferase [Hyphomicrobiaceae bacterium]